MRVSTFLAFIIAIGSMAAAPAMAAESCNNAFPQNEEMRFNCDVSSSANSGAESLRDRTEMYNAFDGGDQETWDCWCVIQFQEAFNVTLASPITLSDESLCPRPDGTMTGTRIYGGCDNDENAQVVIDASGFTQGADSGCAFELGGGLGTKHQIREITIKVGRADKAICDEDGNSLYGIETPNCGGTTTDECEFGGVEVEVIGTAGPVDCGKDLDGDKIGENCDDFPGDRDNDGLIDKNDLCPTIPASDKTRESQRRSTKKIRTVGKGMLGRIAINAGMLMADTDGDGNADSCDPDDDNDGILDGQDNCPTDPNGSKGKKTGQADRDNDDIGDLCDEFPDDPNNDIDGDEFPAEDDNCPFAENPTQTDTDGDGIGDACDGFNDSDNDGVGDTADACPGTPSGTVVLDNGCPDSDGDGVPDNLDTCPGTVPGATVLTDGCTPPGDTDGDGVIDPTDNCPAIPNPAQDDLDADGTGDSCDDDDDGDTVPDATDNCPLLINAAQADADGDGVGDPCEPDTDGDGVIDDADNCTFVANPGQEDLLDGDGIGDACECPDADSDQICDASDLCPGVASVQGDADGDLAGDECDTDGDGDGVANATDNCDLTANPAQTDTDGDGIGDACEGSPFTTDTDGDGVMDFFDCAPLDSLRLSILECYGDRDGDGLTDVQEAQRGTDPLSADTDNDGVMDPLDCSPTNAVVGVSSTCGGTVRFDVDPDGDGIGLGDNCPFVANATQRDADTDGFGDDCDLSPDEEALPDRDTDGDGRLDNEDNCRLVPNSDQADGDGDGTGDRCEGDQDGDSVADSTDNCPSHFNLDQNDVDRDGRGDPCDEDFVIQPAESTGSGGCSLIVSQPIGITTEFILTLGIGLLALLRKTFS